MLPKIDCAQEVAAVDKAAVSLFDENGAAAGVLSVAVLANRHSGRTATPSLIKSDADDGLEVIQLLEGAEYAYAINLTFGNIQ